MRACFRSVFFQGARLSLLAATLSSVVARSTVGGAFVLHQHGTFKTHLHLLGQGDLLANAQESTQFGHAAPTGATKHPAPRVRPIAVVGTGLVFVFDDPTGKFDAAARQSWQPCLLVVPQLASFGERWVEEVLTSPAEKSIATILKRNHTLLL